MVQEDTQASADNSDAADKVVETEASAVEGDKQDINWEDRATTAEARIAQQADDLRSAQGQLRKQQGVDALIAGFSDQLQGVQAGTAAMARAMADGNLDTLGDEVSAIEQRTQTKAAATNRQQLSASLGEGLQAAIQGDDGKPILDLMNAPELEGVRKTWNAGLDQLDSQDIAERAEGRATLIQAISDAKTEALAAERAAHKKELASLEAGQKAAREKALEDAGVEDMSVGVGGAAVGGDLLSKLGDPSTTVSRDDIVKAAEQFRKQGIRL